MAGQLDDLINALNAGQINALNVGMTASPLGPVYSIQSGQIGSFLNVSVISGSISSILPLPQKAPALRFRGSRFDDGQKKKFGGGDCTYSSAEGQ